MISKQQPGTGNAFNLNHSIGDSCRSVCNSFGAFLTAGLFFHLKNKVLDYDAHYNLGGNNTAPDGRKIRPPLVPVPMFSAGRLPSLLFLLRLNREHGRYDGGVGPMQLLLDDFVTIELIQGHGDGARPREAAFAVNDDGGDI